MTLSFLIPDRIEMMMMMMMNERPFIVPTFAAASTVDYRCAWEEILFLSYSIVAACRCYCCCCSLLWSGYVPSTSGRHTTHTRLSSKFQHDSSSIHCSLSLLWRDLVDETTDLTRLYPLLLLIIKMSTSEMPLPTHATPHHYHYTICPIIGLE